MRAFGRALSGALQAVGLLLAGSLTACLGSTPPPRDGPAKDSEGTHVVLERGGLRLHALRAGWVRVKAAHYELTTPHFWRLPRIILGRAWADWMPIIVYAVERLDGSVVLVDAGVAPDINDPAYLACDGNNDWFYRRNLAFDVKDGDTLLERMAQAGLAPDKVTDIVVTHFHADHMGNVPRFENAAVWVGPGNWPDHVGATTCPLGPGWAPRVADYPDGPAGGFDRSRVIGDDPRVRMVPLPGHTPGHAGVLVEVDGERWLMAGDATFNLDQTERAAVSGVTEDIDAAVGLQKRLWAAVRDEGLVVLPAHDLGAFERLAP